MLLITVSLSRCLVQDIKGYFHELIFSFSITNCLLFRRLALIAWGYFHARSRFARSTAPEEKMRTTRSRRFITHGCVFLAN